MRFVILSVVVMSLCVIIPVKKLELAKSRLSKTLTEEMRKSLVLEMLKTIINTVKSCKIVDEIVIVSPDDRIISFAQRENVSYIKDRGLGLNNAIMEAVQWCISRGFEKVLIILGDVPLIESRDIEAMLKMCSSPPEIIITPSRDGGTNCLLLHPPSIFKPLYGYRSFERYLEYAKRNKIKVKIYTSDTTRIDVDREENLMEIFHMISSSSCKKERYNELYMLLREFLRRNSDSEN